MAVALVLAAAALAYAPASAGADPGDLDPSFGGDGRVRTDFGGDSGSERAAAVLPLPDGRTIVVGTVASGGFTNDLLVARLNADGELDEGFGSAGLVRTRIANGRDLIASDAVLQPNGKIVVVGSTGPKYWEGAPGRDFAVVRFLPDGTLDQAFSGDGIATVSFQGDDVAKAVSVQADGSITIAGSSDADYETWEEDLAVARLDPDGSLDTGFSGDGKAFTDIDPDDEALEAVVPLDDGGFIAVGRTAPERSEQRTVLLRYGADGSLDPSFGVGGIVLDDVDPGQPRGAEFAVRQGRGIVVATVNAALARYDLEGVRDPSFGEGGLVRVDFGDGFRVSALATDADDRLVVAGSAGFDNGTCAVGHCSSIVRLAADGEPDPSFSGDGAIVHDIGGERRYGPTDVAAQSDGRIITSGAARSAASSRAPADIAVTRYTSQGTLDQGFSGDGLALVKGLGTGSDEARALTLQADGKLVAVGWAASVDGDSDFALARYRPNGSLDPSFGDDGRVTTGLGAEEGAHAAALQPDGRIVVAGSSSVGDLVLARYMPDGTLDRSFGGDGIVRTDPDDHGSMFSPSGTWQVELYPDGRVLIGVGPLSEVAMLRYRPNGSLDRSFGDGGVVPDVSGRGYSYELALQRDGRIVQVGVHFLNPGSRPTITRYLERGTLDPSFARNGRKSLELSGIGGVTLQPGGMIVDSFKGGLVLTRLTRTGRIDRGFGDDGSRRYPPPPSWDSWLSVLALANNGALLAQGFAMPYNTVLACYTPAGDPDSSFGRAGVAVVDLGERDEVNAIALDEAGVFVGGMAKRRATGEDFAVERYELGSNGVC